MLRLPQIRLIRPARLADALAALATRPAPRVLAGGTDLLVSFKLGHAPSPQGANSLLSLSDLPLSGLEQTPEGWRFGPTTTLWDLASWEPPDAQPALRILPEAARLVAAPPIRSRATVGGNLCLDTRCAFYNQSAFWRSGRPACRKAGGNVCHVAPGGDRCFACHQSDLAPAMIALGAAVRLESAHGVRERPAQELYSGQGDKPLDLREEELLTRVTVPFPPAGAGTGWEKIRMRRGLDFAGASAAVYLEAGADGLCADARVVLGALGSAPLRVPEAETALRGTRLAPQDVEAAADEAKKAARPMRNVDFTPAYRRQMAGVAVSRATRRAWEMASRGARPTRNEGGPS